MIVKETETSKKTCPIMGNNEWRCVGASCMAWRPYAGGLGFCGLCNPARDSGTPDENAIKHAVAENQPKRPL